jgi:hypothetical protein
MGVSSHLSKVMSGVGLIGLTLTPALLLGRQFLQDNGWEFEVVWDLGMPEQWLLLTNYESIESKGDEVEED